MARATLVLLCAFAMCGLMGAQARDLQSSLRSLLQANGTNGGKPANGTSGGRAANGGAKKLDDDGVDKAVMSLKAANISITGATIFAPNNEALAELNKKLNLTGEDYKRPNIQEASISVIGLHVIPGKKIFAKDIAVGNTTVATLSGKSITVTKRIDNDGDDKGEQEVMVRGPGNKEAAEVEKADIEWNGNVVHVIDKVLLP